MKISVKVCENPSVSTAQKLNNIFHEKKNLAIYARFFVIQKNHPLWDELINNFLPFGRWGIRTPVTLRQTPFPTVRDRPLCQPSMICRQTIWKPIFFSSILYYYYSLLGLAGGAFLFTCDKKKPKIAFCRQ